MSVERACLADYLGDWVTFRNLEPLDERLRGLTAIRRRLGLPDDRVPRKTEPVSAVVIVDFLHQVQSLRGAGVPLARLLYVGDTQMSDGSAIANLGQYLPIWSFIGADRMAEALHIDVQRRRRLMIANRWTALTDFLNFADEEGFGPGPELAVLIDLDKTALGARGRNDGAVDRARVEAVQRTVAEALGDAFRLDTFLPVYNELNTSPYHLFTADNQDYLAYISLMVSAGVYDFAALLEDLRAERMANFAQFVEVCGQRLTKGGETLTALRPIHEEVEGNLRRGDPTPFKSFRYREYETTVARMDSLPDDVPEEMRLVEEIVSTREVMAAAQYWHGQGALLFGLSDKPDEASLPRPHQAAQGALPLHRVPMKVVGGELQGF